MDQLIKTAALSAALVLCGFGVQAQGQPQACGSYPSGQTEYECSCPPMSEQYGSVWGSNPYTLDSNVCMAAVHAGVLGEFGGVVVAYATDGLASYEASLANGVPSKGWGAYDASFSFDVLIPDPIYTDDVIKGAVQACAGFPDNRDALTCSCTGPATAKGTFWGNDPYTIDSDICIAARHSGIITETGGTVTAIRVMGLEMYSSTLNNGVESEPSGPFPGSMVFDRN